MSKNYSELADSEVVFEYHSSNWTQERFERSGGFVAVVLNYNKRAFIREAVRGALSQSLCCYELIFMDDCSTDGSDQIMLETIKDFVCTHSDDRAISIKVVFNKTNRTTLGQWRLAVRISSGKWYVMFCGDDVSYPSRLEILHNLTLTHKGLIATCTNADVLTEKGAQKLCHLKNDLVWHAGDADRPYYFLYGCTAMWRRDVLKKLYGRCNLDDFILFWLSIILAGDDRDAEIVWRLSESTIMYSDTAGISSEIKNAARSSRHWIVRKWRQATATRNFGRKYGINSWKIIYDFDQRYGRPGKIRDQIYGYMQFGRVESGTWFQRLRVFFVVNAMERKNDYGGKGAWIRGTIRRYFLDFIAGNCSFVFFAFLRAFKYGFDK